MGCFDDIIALKGACTEVTPTSGFYLNDIDLHRNEIEQFIETPYNDVDSFVDDKIAFAVTQVQNAVLAHYSSLFLPRSVLAGERIGFPADNLTVKSGGAVWRGITVELINDSSYIDFYLSELSLWLDFSGAVSMKVYDMIENKLLDTIAVTAVAGQITKVYPSKTYKSDRKRLYLFIGYDSAGINSYQTNLRGSDCSSCRRTSNVNNGWIDTVGAEIALASDFIRENVVGIGHTSGISVNYSLNCNHKDWICSNAGMLALPILYRTAGDIMDYAINTTQRFNTRTNVDLDNLKNKRDFYNDKYTWNLESVLRKMILPSDRNCFVCNERARVSYSM